MYYWRGVWATPKQRRITNFFCGSYFVLLYAYLRSHRNIFEIFFAVFCKMQKGIFFPRCFREQYLNCIICSRFPGCVFAFSHFYPQTNKCCRKALTTRTRTNTRRLFAEGRTFASGGWADGAGKLAGSLGTKNNFFLLLLFMVVLN